MLSQMGLTEIPKELLNETFHIWRGDIDTEKDWDDFIGGQLVNHTYYEKSFRGAVDTESLEFGSSPNSFYSLLTANGNIELYTTEAIDLTGKFVSIGKDIDKKYLATSIRLSGFDMKEKKNGKVFATKIILVDVVKYLSDQMDDDTPAPTINFANGKMGESVTVPLYKPSDESGDIGETLVEEFVPTEITNEVPNVIEILIPVAAAVIGHDQVNSKNGGANPLGDYRKEAKKASTKPKHFPTNPLYSILPAQFAIHSIDNYGFSHQNDPANAIKTLLATQTMGSAANTATSLAASNGILGKATSAITSGAIGLAQKFFGDKGTLANSSAIASIYATGDSSTIKFFIQGDSAKAGGHLNENGYLQLAALKAENSYMEVNQANGQFAKYGKSMSPSENDGFDKPERLRGMNLGIIKMNKPTIPALATPIANGTYSGLKINDTKINDFLNWGAVRQYASDDSLLTPMLTPEHFLVMIRSMFFRPDGYSFYNWPMLVPAELTVFDVEKPVSIAYDTKAVDFASDYGILNDIDNSGKIKRSFHNKSIILEQIAENDLYDPNKTFVSMRFEFAENDLKEIYQSQLQAFTKSVVEYKFIKAPVTSSGTVRQNATKDEEQVLRHHKYNSQGKNIGTAASVLSVFQH